MQIFLQEINEYIESATNNLIKDVVPSDLIRNDTRLMIINAMYFQGTWEEQFMRENQTKLKKFYVSEDKVIEVSVLPFHGHLFLIFHNSYRKSRMYLDGTFFIRFFNLGLYNDQLLG